MLQVTDRFNTVDGHWYVEDRPYSVTKEAIEKYAMPMELGGATHIYVKAKPNVAIWFYTKGADDSWENVYSVDIKESGWGNMGMQHSSAYVPSRGEVGPWFVDVDGVNVASGIGLPDGLHVSTFLVVEDVVDVPVPQPKGTHVQVLVDGVVVFDEWV